MLAMVARSASGEVVQPLAEELDELADDALLAQDLRDGEDEVGRGRAFGQPAEQAKPDHQRHEHRHGLAEHRRLRLDAADAPAEHAQAVDHRRVRIGADQRVGIERAGRLIEEDDACQVFEIDLVHNPGLRRNDAEVAQCFLPPAQKRVAFEVAFVFQVGVRLKGAGGAEAVDLHRVIDDQLDRLQRIDAPWIAAHAFHGVAHGRQIDDCRHAGEVLQQHPARRERDLAARFGARVPLRQRHHVLGADVDAVLGAQEVFEQHLHRVGQTLGERVLLEDRVKPADGVGLVVDAKRALTAKAVGHGGGALQAM